MVEKCANPECGEPFVHYRAGKIYRVDRHHPMNFPAPRGAGQKIEHFWLCGRCSPTLTVILHSDGSVAVSEARLAPRNPQWDRPSSLPAIGSAGSIDLSPQPEREDRVEARISRPRAGSRRILVLDEELKTVGFIEQMLQDSGLSATTSTSTVEAISLLATGFFDVFIVIDRPTQSHAGEPPSVLVAARVHCESCFCWSVENVRQRCNEFIEAAMRWKPETGSGDLGTAVPPCPERDLSAQQKRGSAA